MERYINYFATALLLSFLVLECTKGCPNPAIIIINGILGIMNLLFSLEGMLRSIVPKIKMQIYEVDRRNANNDSTDDSDNQDSSLDR